MNASDINVDEPATGSVRHLYFYPMKPHISVISAFLSFSLIAISSGQSTYERELKQLVEQHEKAINAATDPINARFVTSAEQLLRRATQAGDLDTALKIKQSLQNTGRDFTGNWKLENAVWHADLELRSDGTYHQVKSDTAAEFDDVWKPAINGLELTHKGSKQQLVFVFKNRILIAIDKDGKPWTLTKKTR